MASGEQASGRGQVAFVILALFLIGLFLWRFFVPAHEYPSRSTRYLTLAFDAGMLVGLIVLRRRTADSFYEDSTRTMAMLLFLAGLAAAIGLFLIRLTGHEAWMTGHRIYYLLPR